MMLTRFIMSKALVPSFTTMCLSSTISVFKVASVDQEARASETIYIRADGSVEPATTRPKGG